MSLTGNLEDLPLLDILQIVSFSKKTGYLSIETPEGEGAIVFRDGFVVSCFTPGTPPLDASSSQLPRPQRDPLIRGQIEVALERLIRLHEGQFNFSLTDEPPRRVGARDITNEMLEGGINPQELVLDLARGMDEDRRNSSAAIEVGFARPDEDSFEEDLSEVGGEARLTEIPLVEPAPPPEPVPPDATQRVPPPPPAPPPAAPERVAETPRTILLVEDEEDIRTLLGQRFAEAGYAVVEAEDPDRALKEARKLKDSHVPFLLVTDLGMPTSGGASFQGGFEIIKRLGKMHLRPATLLMTESPNAAAQARARQLGINQLVFKPGLSKLDPPQFRADLEAFAARVIADILPSLTRHEVPRPSGPGRAVPRAPLAPDELTRQFSLLQRHLAELRQPSNANQISILIVKAAREFFERAILFLIKSEEARGLGGFGKVSRNEKINLLVRGITIPINEPSVFRDVVASGKPFAGPPPDGRWEQHVFAKCGRFKSVDFALIPLLAHRETIAILFGDNPETGRALGRLDALEVFVSQAGIALENVFLQRKIEVLQRG